MGRHRGGEGSVGAVVTNKPGLAEWQALVQLTGPAPTLGPAPLDWDYLIDLALRHKVLLLLQHGLAAHCPQDMPAAAKSRLRRLALQRAAHALAGAREIVRVSEILARAEVPATVIKGAPLSQQIHGDVARRDPGDIDLIVPKSRVRAAALALEADGFEADYGALVHVPRQLERVLTGTNQLAYLHKPRLVAVELHWRWQKIDGMMPLDPSRVWADDRVRLGGHDVAVPDPVEHFVYLCAHGAGHGWHRLKWLNDIRWILHAPDMINGDWAAVAERARALKMQSAVGAAVLLAQRLDGGTLPPELEELIGQTPRARALASQSEAWMLEDAALRQDRMDKRPVQIARGLLRHLHVSTMDQPNPAWTKLRMLTRPSLPDLVTVALPRGCGSGYLVVRLVRMFRRMLTPSGPSPTGRK